MRKQFKYISLIALNAAVVTTPALFALSSCRDDVHYQIESIKLSSRPAYICPGEKLKVIANIFPIEARNNSLNWELTEVPMDGFNISSDGTISAPRNIQIDSPLSLKVKATDPDNPDTYDELSIALINQPPGDNPFLGFVDDKIEFYNRDDEKVSLPIQKDGKNYSVSEPIDMFIGRTKTEIDFVPIVLKGKNSRMKFHLHGEDQTLRSLAWTGYTDNTWTNEIPSFAVSHIQHRHDCMDITFACDEDVHFHIDFNVWQSEIQGTPGIIAYDKSSDYEDDPIVEVGLGQYRSTIAIKETDNNKQQSQYEYQIDLVVFRKPYEYLDELNFSAEVSNECPLPSSEIWFDPIAKPILYERRTRRAYDNYKEYKVSFFFYTSSKIKAETYDYEQVPLLDFKAYSVRMPDSPLCSCNFFVRWLP